MTAPVVPGGQNGPAMVERVRIQVADRLTTELRDYASKAGWPNQLVSRLRVLWNGTLWQVDVPDNIRAAVNELEYGSETRQPNPVLRRFIPRMGTLADKAAAAALVNLGGEVLA